MAPHVADFTLYNALVQILVSHQRVIEPLLVYPPPWIDIYDAYIGLLPLVSTLYICLALYLLQIPVLLISTAPATTSARIFSLTLPLCALIIVVHSPLSGDTALHARPGILLSALAAVLAAWAACDLRALSTDVESRRSARDELTRAILCRSALLRPVVAVAVAVLAAVRTLIAWAVVGTVYFAWGVRAAPADPRDAALCGACAVCVYAKYAVDRMRRAAPADVPPQTGVYRWVRHPETVVDASFWMCFVGIAARIANRITVFPVVAAVAHLAMQVIANGLSDIFLAQRHDEYRKYRARVWMILPFPSRMSSPKSRKSEAEDNAAKKDQ